VVENNVGAYVVGGLKILGGIAIGAGAIAVTVLTCGASAPLTGALIGAGISLAATYATDVVGNFMKNDWKWSASNFLPSSSPGEYIANMVSVLLVECCRRFGFWKSLGYWVWML